ncbi:hypothetical protein [Actinoplanes sp. G11-F43]|uniref:hypothetical protein n=1 Tax=Actinoplanes sp. G11-F43 TaxID=3424130 RepID=UPI003D3391CD
MRLIPPMDDEPPPEYVTFVTRHRPELRSEAYRLVGGSPVFEEIYLAVLTDLAGRWRRLRLLRRAEPYMRQRLTARAAHWREDQVYEVEVRILRPTPESRPRAGSLALRKAEMLPPRPALDALADAEIAWVHAYLRARWRRLFRHAFFVLAVVGALIQYMTWLSADPR